MTGAIDAVGAIGAIVLAGGRSTRFGRDKLGETVDGRPILARAIDAARAVAGEVVVVVAADAIDVAAAGPAGPGISDGVRTIADRSPDRGPLVAVADAIAELRADRILIVAGDMPWLVPAVLRTLVDELDDPGRAAAILGSAGRPQPLPCAVRRATATVTARRLVDAGERRFGALIAALEPVVVPVTRWRVLDPEGMSLRDVDTPDDLVDTS